MAKDGRNAAIIAGVALGAAALAAASRSHQSEYYGPDQRAAGGRGAAASGLRLCASSGDELLLQRGVSSHPGVTCYPAQRACYKANGNYSPTISGPIYGY